MIGDVELGLDDRVVAVELLARVAGHLLARRHRHMFDQRDVVVQGEIEGLLHAPLLDHELKQQPLGLLGFGQGEGYC